MNKIERGDTVPFPSEVAEVRAIFAGRNGIFVKNIIVSPEDPNANTLKQVRASLESLYSNYDLSFRDDYVVSEEGPIFDGVNYARWHNTPDGIGYAVYVRPKGQKSIFSDAKGSQKRFLQFIKATSEGFPLIAGSESWEKIIVDSAKQVFGKKWQDKVLAGALIRP